MNRFSQKDIIRGSVTDPASLNRYAYVQNDPVNFIDSSGQSLKSFVSGAVNKVSSAAKSVASVDNYAGLATKTALNNASLYQLEGALNGVDGRFEWIIQDGSVTHRMFVAGGKITGVPIKP